MFACHDTYLDPKEAKKLHKTLKEIRDMLNRRHAQKCYEGAVDTSPDVIELRIIFGLIFDNSPGDTREPVSPPLAKAKGVSETEVLL